MADISIVLNAINQQELYSIESLEKRVMLSVSGQTLLAGFFTKRAVFQYQITTNDSSNVGFATETLVGPAIAPTGH